MLAQHLTQGIQLKHRPSRIRPRFHALLQGLVKRQTCLGSSARPATRIAILPVAIFKVLENLDILASYINFASPQRGVLHAKDNTRNQTRFRNLSGIL